MTTDGYQKEIDSDCREATWPKGLYRRAGSFRFRRMGGRHRVIEVWGSMPEADAIRKAARYDLDLDEGRLPAEEHARREMTVAAFAHGVWLKKKATELRPGSLARYRSVVEHFIEYLERRGLRPAVLGAIGYEAAADYVAHRASAPLVLKGQKKFTREIRHGASKKTVHFEREILFQMFKEAVRRELIRRNPFADVRTRKPSPHEVAAVHHPLPMDEEAALLRAAEELDRSGADKKNPRFRDMVLFLVRTGLREDEMRHLEWADVDWKEGLIHVRQKRVQEDRVVPIPRSAVPGLRKRLAGRRRMTRCSRARMTSRRSASGSTSGARGTSWTSRRARLTWRPCGSRPAGLTPGSPRGRTAWCPCARRSRACSPDWRNGSPATSCSPTMTAGRAAWTCSSC